MFYLYRHIRIDTNQPFYIGVGKKRVRSPNSYERAYTKRNRNRYWTNIYNKTTIRVEILFECNTRKEVLDKEVEFISIYGRKDINTGILVNQTNGRDGLYGGGNNKLIKVYSYDLNGNYLGAYSSIKEASFLTNTSKADISACCRYKRPHANKIQWRYTKELRVPALLSRKERCRNTYHNTMMKNSIKKVA